MAFAALAATAISGGIQAYSTYKQGQIENEVAGINAQAEENAAIQANLEAIEQQRRQRQANRGFRGTQRVQIAASGAVGGTGSPAEIEAETAARQELALQDEARAAGAARQRGFNSAAMTRYGGRMAKRAGVLGAIGTAIGTAGSFASQYQDYKYKGVIKARR